MRKWICILLSLVLLTFINTIAFAFEPKKVDKINEDHEVQLLIKQLREIRKQERALQDEVVSKSYTIRTALEQKDEKFKRSVESYNNMIMSINTNMKQIKEKKIAAWAELKIARDNKNIDKVKLQLKSLVYLEKQTVENINKKLSVLDSMISVIK